MAALTDEVLLARARMSAVRAYYENRLFDYTLLAEINRRGLKFSVKGYV
tara:strand:+ start:553 stop:699 length:147 start_codon:yes stop_codon:yes gene_type:complete